MTEPTFSKSPIGIALRVVSARAFYKLVNAEDATAIAALAESSHERLLPIPELARLIVHREIARRKNFANMI